MKRRDVAYFAAECALLLFLCPAAIGAYAVWRQGAQDFSAYSVVLGIPATASLALVLASELAPGLLGNGRLSFPLNLTLPIAYLPLLLASLVLWTTNRGSIEATPEMLLPAHLWRNPLLLAATFAGQVVLLTLVMIARRQPRDEQTW
ncbi:MAG TPA: hypothetical protein VGE01_08625 [Fimbriimonas sp.]